MVLTKKATVEDNGVISDMGPPPIDVIIIGGGPAGLSALLWCSELGLKARLFEKETELGGQLLRTYGAITNHLGIVANSGRSMRDRFVEQVSSAAEQCSTTTPVIRADLAGRRIELGDGTVVSGKAILIATGARRRKLNVPGENEFQGRGILESGVKAKDNVANRNVLIVGGGDSAFENALILSEAAKKVYVVHRRDEFTARSEFVEQVRANCNIHLLTDRRILAFKGADGLETVEVVDADRKATKVSVDFALVRIGVDPCTELFAGQVAMGNSGYIRVDRRSATSVPSVYAAGDVVCHDSPTISNAVGNGTSAARSIYADLDRMI